MRSDQSTKDFFLLVRENQIFHRVWLPFDRLQQIHKQMTPDLSVKSIADCEWRAEHWIRVIGVFGGGGGGE